MFPWGNRDHRFPFSTHFHGGEDMKCQVCKRNEREWLWQPLGPSEKDNDIFVLLGHQYWGFPTIAVCDACHIAFPTKPHVSVRQRHGASWEWQAAGCQRHTGLLAWVCLKGGAGLLVRSYSRW